MGAVRTIKTSMRARQSVLVAVVPVNVEAAEAIHALKLTKAIEGDFAGACNEL